MIEIPTVRIKNRSDYLIINEQDFNPSLHERYEDSASDAKSKKIKEIPTTHLVG